MSTAHRPTWDPAQAKEVKGGSRQYSVRDVASHTKLKFRQPGQTSTAEVSRKDLRTELLAAEQESREKKRKANGLSVAPVEDEKKVSALTAPKEDEDANRRKALGEAIALDRDSDEEEEEEEGRRKRRRRSKRVANAIGERESSENGANESTSDESSEGEKDENVDKDEDEDEEEDESEEEDDTAELLRELARIKRERQEEKERQEREQNTKAQLERDEQIATANPLLNLAAALGQHPGVDTTAKGTFAVKRRWDDDLIFKNQAMNAPDKPSGQFVNDLLRTEFHKKFMAKFIK